uniref:Conserved plasma membrane protein n=1 Tax=Macrostomum lignano TaxID=282301 RepID=A0A1I8HQI9_9PLAT
RPISHLLKTAATDSPLPALQHVGRGRVSWLPGLIDQFVKSKPLLKLGHRGSGVSVPAPPSNIQQLEELPVHGRQSLSFEMSRSSTELNKPLLVGRSRHLPCALSNISSADCNATDPTESTRTSGLGRLPSHRFCLRPARRLPQAAAAVRQSELHGRPPCRRLASLGAELSSETRLQAADLPVALDGGLGSSAKLLDSIILPHTPRHRGAVRELLRPYNGFWSGFGLCLICLLPALCLAIKLANLYRKTQKYLPDMQDGNPKPV